MLIVRKSVLAFLFLVAGLLLPAVQAQTTTNSIIALADFAESGFQTGFGIGVPILILVVMLGWLLFGLRTGIKGKK